MMNQEFKKNVFYTAGLEYALIAMSFFRGRHQVRRRYPGARPGSPRSKEVIRCFESCVQDARKYIKLARLCGFKGSINGI